MTQEEQQRELQKCYEQYYAMGAVVAKQQAEFDRQTALTTQAAGIVSLMLIDSLLLSLCGVRLDEHAS